ncbi:MAG: LamG domain-containing protein, partial [Thermodesulfovibrionales bacterium]|nr:LamG domain-containing protein [Thermodesulfovibrionales bacterium]
CCPGGTCTDLSAYGNHGTLHITAPGGCTDGVPGFTGKALYFDGNDFIRVSSPSNLPLGNSPKTMEAWIKPYSYPDTTYNGIIAYGQMACPSKGSLLSIKNDGRLSMAFWCNDAYQTVGPAATLDKWNHVLFTYDGGTTVKFYMMNGEFVQESSLTAGIPAATQNGPIRIGCTDNPGRYFNGLIDEVRIYNRALIAMEIQKHYVEGLKRHQSLVM